MSGPAAVQARCDALSMNLPTAFATAGAYQAPALIEWCTDEFGPFYYVTVGEPGFTGVMSGVMDDFGNLARRRCFGRPQ